jgi:hypothetical protein
MKKPGKREVTRLKCSDFFGKTTSKKERKQW